MYVCVRTVHMWVVCAWERVREKQDNAKREAGERDVEEARRILH